MTSTSQVSLALIINVLSYILTQWLGLSIDNVTLTTTVETLVIIGTAIWALIQHKKVVAGKGI